MKSAGIKIIKNLLISIKLLKKPVSFEIFAGNTKNVAQQKNSQWAENVLLKYNNKYKVSIKF